MRKVLITGVGGVLTFRSRIIVTKKIIKLVIEEANWLTVYKDIQSIVGNGFDAVLCLGNSFAHMLDSFGDQREQKRAIQNFKDCVKPGGLLLIDHRNYDNIMNTGSTPSKCIYYNVSVILQFLKRSIGTLNLSISMLLFNENCWI